MDKIFLRELEIEAVIGIWAWERRIRQRVSLSLEMAADIRAAAATDQIEDTLNYKAVAKRVLAYVKETRFQLVETLSEEVARLILTEFPVDWVRVTLHKPGAIRHSKDVGVIIERTKADLAATRDA